MTKAQAHYEDQPSPRQQAARALAQCLIGHGLILPDAVQRSDDRRCWRFAVRSVRLQGQFQAAGVEVFGEDYFRVSWDDGGMYPARRIFGGSLDAEAFVIALLILDDWPLAVSIPARVPKRLPKPPVEVKRNPLQVEEDHFGKPVNSFTTDFGEPDGLL